MKTFDQIWLRVVKVGGFLLGAYIMYHEAFTDGSDRPYLYAAALAMMGTQIGETFSNLMDKANEMISLKKKKGVGPEHKSSEHRDEIDQ
jgi:hypothetical protein